MAMDHRDGMSPGKLITYQLYWNMLNNSYKNLLDIVTSFTRSSSAAQVVSFTRGYLIYNISMIK
jgi:hypothetical protein